MNYLRKTGIAVLCGSMLAFTTGADHHAPEPSPAATPPSHHDTPAAATASATQPAKDATVTPDAALELLVQGNDRFTTNMAEHARADQGRRCDTFTNGQHPFAVVLTCADSRVPPELLFDQGIGDLFVVRVAGNVADTDEIGTIEYGVEHLLTPLIVVMGHTKCGAVTAVVNDAKLPPNIANLVDNIKPAADRAKRENPNLKGDALIAAATRANVFHSIQDMFEHSEEIRELVAHGKVNVVGAVYDIHGGSVQWLGPHPNQTQLLLKTSETTAHQSEGDGARAAEPSQEPARSAAVEHGPHGDASTKTTTRAGGGLLIPAAFLGGAGIMSSAVIYAIKPRAAKTGSVEGAGATTA